MSTIYRTKIGWEIIALIGAGMFPAAITVGFDKESSPEDLYILGGCFVFTLVLLSMIWYKIDHQTLRIYAFFIPYKPIDIKTITEITETNSPLSAPASSMNRLKIIHAKGSILISPKNKNVFLKQLTEINPNIIFIPQKVK